MWFAYNLEYRHWSISRLHAHISSSKNFGWKRLTLIFIVMNSGCCLPLQSHPAISMAWKMCSRHDIVKWTLTSVIGSFVISPNRSESFTNIKEVLKRNSTEDVIICVLHCHASQCSRLSFSYKMFEIDGSPGDAFFRYDTNTLQNKNNNKF